MTRRKLETFLPDNYPDLSEDNFVKGRTNPIGKRLKVFLEKGHRK